MSAQFAIGPYWIQHQWFGYVGAVPATSSKIAIDKPILKKHYGWNLIAQTGCVTSQLLCDRCRYFPGNASDLLEMFFFSTIFLLCYHYVLYILHCILYEWMNDRLYIVTYHSYVTYHSLYHILYVTFYMLFIHHMIKQTWIELTSWRCWINNWFLSAKINK